MNAYGLRVLCESCKTAKEIDFSHLSPYSKWTEDEDLWFFDCDDSLRPDSPMRKISLPISLTPSFSLEEISMLSDMTAVECGILRDLAEYKSVLVLSDSKPEVASMKNFSKLISTTPTEKIRIGSSAIERLISESAACKIGNINASDFCISSVPVPEQVWRMAEEQPEKFFEYDICFYTYRVWSRARRFIECKSKKAPLIVLLTEERLLCGLVNTLLSLISN